MDQITDYLATTSERFRQVYAEFAQVVRLVFPNATETFEYKMPGFKVRASDEEIKEWKGTIDPNYLQIFLVERKNGITLHLWNPVDFNGLDKRREELTRVGFKVMVGCLQWNRRQAYPIEAVESLLESIRGQFAPFLS